MFLDQVQRLGAGRVLGDGDNLGDHEIAHAGGDVAQVDRQGLAKPAEDGVDADVGVAAPGGDIAGLAARLLQGRVGDGRADGIGVRVFVADDIGDPVGRGMGRCSH